MPEACIIGTQNTSVVAGTSSFGMSGVNAHAMFSAPHTATVTATRPLPLCRSRYWYILGPFATSAYKGADDDHSVLCSDGFEKHVLVHAGPFLGHISCLAMQFLAASMIQPRGL